MFGLRKVFVKCAGDVPCDEHKELMAEYRDIISKIHQARNAFQSITEPKLVEACVHEMNALQAQYSYLLQKLKDENITSSLL